MYLKLEKPKIPIVTLCRCQDYILIDRGQFGTTEICGNQSFITRELKLNEGKFKVFFRSSEEVKGEGFQMYVICFRVADRDMPGNNFCVYTCLIYVCLLRGFGECM